MFINYLLNYEGNRSMEHIPANLYFFIYYHKQLTTY